MTKFKLSKSILVIGVIICALITLITNKPPKAKDAEAPLTEFSAERAFSHIEAIAQKPHMMSTDEHRKVREYIIDECEKLGLETSVQATTAIFDFRGSVSAGYVYNVVAVLKGKEDGPALMVTGHYDSQPNTLGAADDGVAIASMLEAARVLKELPQLKNDVIFLFSDGEESGLFGAQAFVKEHPLRDRIGLVLNLEARGSKGTSFTYEVSENNGWIMREYGKAVRYPIASSLAYEVYKLMSNNSDFTVHKMAGYSGFNTAFIEDYVDYHSMTDSPENLDLRSLQHQGTYVLDISKHFGELDLVDPKSPDLVYFNIWGFKMVSYPKSWNLFIIVLILILFIGVLIFGIRNKEISVWRFLVSFLVFVVGLGLSLGAVYLLAKGIKNWYPWYNNFYDANFYNVSYYFAVFSFVCLFFFSLIYAILIKKLKQINLWMGVLLFGVILMNGIELYIPTGLFLAAGPLLLILSFLLISFIFKWKDDQRRKQILLTILFIPIITSILPMVKILFVTFSLGMAFGGAFLMVLLIGCVLPALLSAIKAQRWFPMMLSLVLAIMFFLLAHINSGYTPDKPLQSKLMYVQNVDTDESLWVAPIGYMDDWKAYFFDDAKEEALTEIFPHAGRVRLKNKAAWTPVEEPELQVIMDTICDGKRILTLNIASCRGGENAQFYIHKDAEITHMFINHLELTDQAFFEVNYGDYYFFNFYGMQEEGLELMIYSKPEVEFELIMLDKKLGLPIFEENQKMPANIIPAAGYEANQHVVRKSWRF